MIQNERQYGVTKTNLERFQTALERVENAKDLHPVQRKAQVAAIRSEIEIMRADLREYEALLEGDGGRLDVEAVLALPENLIRARIAAGLTHKDLAGLLGVKEQQVQRYESTQYRSASLERVIRVAEVIARHGVEGHTQLARVK
jgi:DNA-binding XRE family transcriptional regulator